MLPRAPVASASPRGAASSGALLRRFHLFCGLLVLITFLGTGQYMDLRHDHLRGMDDATRLLFRSNHIYILWAGLLHLALGLYLIPRENRWSRRLQLIGSALMFLSAGLLVTAFFMEPLGAGMARPFTGPAIYSVFAGSLLHLVAGIGRRQTARAADSTLW